VTGPLVGRTLGRFRVIARLGAGGMGEVYRAHDEHLKRDVAIKVLQADQDRARQDQIRREAHALSTLNHPNIATIHDLVDIDGISFVVMELIEGESLAERVRQGPLPASRVIDYARQIAAGLQEAHRRGLVHRDLKPANLMVTAGGQLKIVDFGIATAQTMHDSATATNVDSGVATGTLPYMAPEQIAGGAVDARADIWSFGAVLYELSTGTRPFQAANALMLAERILNHDPEAPSVIVPDVPMTLERVILRALAKEPGLRFQTVGEMSAALESAGPLPSPVEARPPKAPGRARWLMPVLLAAAIAVSGVAWKVWRDASQAGAGTSSISVLVGDAVNRTGDPTFDDTLVELLTTSLNQSRFLSIYPRTRVAYTLRLMQRDPATAVDEAVGREIIAREGVDVLVTTSVSRLGDAFVLVVTAMDASGAVRGSASATFNNPAEFPARLDAMVRELRTEIGEADASVRASSAPLAEVTSRSLEALQFYTQGVKRARAGDPAGAMVLYQKALEIDPEFAMAHDALGIAYTNLQDMVQAEVHLGKAAALADRVQESERHKILADYNLITRNYEVACDHLQVFRQLRPLDPAPVTALANCRGFLFDFDTAIADARAGLAIQSSPLAQAILARLQLLAGKVEDALAGANALRAGGPAPFAALFVAGRAELLLERFDEAGRTYDGIVALGGDAEVEGWLGRFDLARARGRLTEAATAIESALRAAERRGNVAASSRAATAAAELALTRGDREAAVQLAARFTGRRQVTVMYLTGRTLARAGQHTQAAALVPAMTAAASAVAPDQSLRRLLDAEIALARNDAAAAVAAADDAFALEASVLARETQARAYAAAGRTRDAIDAYQQVIARASERTDAVDSPGVWRAIQSRYELAVLLDNSGDRGAARPHFDRLLTWWASADASDARVADVHQRVSR
jgi:tetratricopeptide (TPR) repeat protein/predicted Ser/Thr protein kinase